MSNSFSLGKQWGLRRMQTPQNHFAMIALDQRPIIANLVASKRGVPVAQVSFKDMIDFKGLIVDSLVQHASALLLDPNYALPAAIDKISASTGLIVTIEDHRFKETFGGRLSHSIENWSVEKIKRAGADAVKALVWYRPDADPEVISHQKNYVETIGRECHHLDIAFVLELLVYPFSLNTDITSDYVKFPEKLPELVLQSVSEFTHPRFGVDLLKLESPLFASSLPECDGTLSHLKAQTVFNEMGRLCSAANIPWVMLSAGVSSEQFYRVMEYAYAAGANGFLAGRSIWWDAMQHFPSLEKCAEQLQEQGGTAFRGLDELTRRAASAWRADYSSLKNINVEGQFCATYL